MVSTLSFWLFRWKILLCWTPLFMRLIEHKDICSSTFPQKKRQNIFLFQEKFFTIYVIQELRCKLINWNNMLYVAAFAVHCLSAIIKGYNCLKIFQKHKRGIIYSISSQCVSKRMLNEYYRSIQTALISTQKLNICCVTIFGRDLYPIINSSSVYD